MLFSLELNGRAVGTSTLHVSDGSGVTDVYCSMPDFFDSHDEFNEWFSKDISAHAQGDGSGTRLTATQLQRLHMILKPFMLRRIKKDVDAVVTCISITADGPTLEDVDFVETSARASLQFILTTAAATDMTVMNI